MLKTDKLLFDYQVELQNKFGYGPEFAQDLVLAGESIVDHLGVEYESVVFGALASCKIVITEKDETVYDRLVKEDMLVQVKDDGTVLTDENIKRSGGIGVSKPSISYDGENFKIDRVQKMIVLKHGFDANSPYHLGKLIHELYHIVRSYLNEYSIEGSTLIQRSGLAITKDELTVVDGKVTRTFKEELGSGFEEGLTSYDQLCTMRKSYDSAYDVEGYDYLRAVASVVTEHMKLGTTIKEAQTTKNYSSLKSAFDANSDLGYEGFLRMMDELMRKEYARQRSVLDEGKLKESTDAMNEYFEKTVCPIVRNMESKIELDMGAVQNGFTKSA